MERGCRFHSDVPPTSRTRCSLISAKFYNHIEGLYVARGAYLCNGGCSRRMWTFVEQNKSWIVGANTPRLRNTVKVACTDALPP